MDGILLDGQYFVPMSNVAIIDTINKKIMMKHHPEWMSFEKCGTVALDPCYGMADFDWSKKKKENAES